WSRSGCGVSWLASANGPLATWPAIWHRQRSTGNAVTGEMQSFASRKDSSVSSIPNPSGLTVPAATTATRALFDEFEGEEKSGIFKRDKRPRILVAFAGKSLY